MKICAIMQPTYMPWLGYFSMIDEVDGFIFLDHVQLVKRSWQVRNRIRAKDKELMLTIPVKKKESRKEMLICDTEINYGEKWKTKHLESMKHYYAKADYFLQTFDFIQEIFNENALTIGEFNMNLIQRVSARIGITTSFVKASHMDEIDGAKDALLVKICKRVSAGSYLSAQGSAGYIEKENPGGEFAKEGIKLYYQNYVHPHYKQVGEGFIPYMGIFDLLFNVGFENALSIIRKGTREKIYYLDYRQNYLHI